MKMIETADSAQRRAVNVGVQRASMNQQQEKAAVLNLLDLQQQRRSLPGPQAEHGKSSKSPRGRRKKTTNKSTNPSRLKQPPNYPSKKRKRQSLDDLLKAQGVVKPPPPFIVPKVFFMDMGKKQKRHRTFHDQFEDAMEVKPYRPTYDSQDDYMSAQISNRNRSRNTQGKLHTTTDYGNQLWRLEQQAEQRRKDLVRLTSSKLKQHLFADFDPSKEVVVPMDDTEASPPQQAEQNDQTDDSSDKVDSGGIFDDAEMSNGFGVSTDATNVAALSTAQNAARSSASTPHPHGIAIYNPYPQPTVAAQVSTALKAAFEDSWTPAFEDTVGQNHSEIEAVATAQQRSDLKDLPLAWEEIDRAPQMPPVPPDTEKKQNPIDKIGPQDVLSGRGSVSNGNLGNAWLRELVQRFKFAYFAAPKGIKRAMAKSIVNYVRSKQGRFLEKPKNSSSWYEVGDEKAFDKLSQLLRERVVEESPPRPLGKPPQPISIEDSLRQSYARVAAKCAVMGRHDSKDLPLVWADVKRSLQVPPVAPDTDKENPIENIGRFDVLHGRGWHDHVGNVWLRDLTQRFRAEYSRAPIKKSMVKSVLNYVRSRGGRFLGKGDKKSPAWYEVGDEKAFSKLSQLLSSGRNTLPQPDSSMDQATQPLQLSQLLRDGMQQPQILSPSAKSAINESAITVPGPTQLKATSESKTLSFEESLRKSHARAAANGIPQTWEEIKAVPQMPRVAPDTKKRNPIENTGQFDVLLGAVLSNAWSKELIQRYRPVYLSAPNKQSVVKSILNYVRSKKGRFLDKRGGNRWYEVGDQEAISKVSQLLSSEKQSQSHGDSSVDQAAQSFQFSSSFEDPESPGKPSLPDLEACKAHIPPQLWDELHSAPKMPPVPPDTEKENPIELIGRSDVSCDEKTWNPGNTWLSELVGKFRLAFLKAPKNARTSLARSILNYVRYKDVRFLFKNKSSIWFEAGDGKALRKILHLLGAWLPQEDVEETQPSLDANCRAHLPAKLWEELCNAPKMPQVEADDRKTNPIVTIGPNDVLCGSGNTAYENLGNVKLRDIMRELRAAYSAASAKGSKSTLMKACMNYVRFKQGRFLEKVGPRSSSTTWYEAGDKRAMLKCYQTLRCVSKENRYWEED